MNEREWSSGEDVAEMLALLEGRASGRKLRLFACACARAVWRRLTDRRSRRAVEAAEGFADGTRRTIARAHTSADAAQYEMWLQLGLDEPETAPAEHRTQWSASLWPLCATGHSIREEHTTDESLLSGVLPRARQAGVLRDLFGHPFAEPPAPPPGVLTPTVRWLAEAAYEQRQLPEGTLEPARLAVLSDALEEAGCADAAILAHLRSAGVAHVRGCWALDLILGKR
jgi:hypothetical protein